MILGAFFTGFTTMVVSIIAAIRSGRAKASSEMSLLQLGEQKKQLTDQDETLNQISVQTNGAATALHSSLERQAERIEELVKQVAELKADRQAAAVAKALAQKPPE